MKGRKRKKPVKSTEGSTEYDGCQNEYSQLASSLEEYCGDFEPFQKNFFKVTDMVKKSETEIDDYRYENDISIDGKKIPGPIMKFTDYKFPKFFMEEIKRLQFGCPTPIQAQAWPIGLSGRDLVGIARTGSGKTLAYILPALIHIINQTPVKNDDGPIALVLAPTRELAQQIHKVAQELGASSEIRIACIYGGAPKAPQKKELETGVQLCIATPGRLMDLLKYNWTNLRRCTYLCLDEADKMLSMGFEEQIRGIIQGIRPDKQTLMFSATWPKEVRKLAGDYLKRAVMLRIGSMSLAANHNIFQIIDVCEDKEKEQKMINFLEGISEAATNKVIIFVQTRLKVDKLTRYMRQHGWPTMALHGEKCQRERDWVLEHFKNGETHILIATDIAARGLDMDNIKFVINFDYPESSEVYVHRIGRTARQNKTGTAYTLFTKKDGEHAEDLITVLTEAKQRINPRLLDLLHINQQSNLSRYKGGPGGGRGRCFVRTYCPNFGS